MRFANFDVLLRHVDDAEYLAEEHAISNAIYQNRKSSKEASHVILVFY